MTFFINKFLSPSTLERPKKNLTEINSFGWSVHTFLFFAHVPEKKFFHINLVVRRPTVCGLYEPHAPDDIVYLTFGTDVQGRFLGKTQIYQKNDLNSSADHLDCDRFEIELRKNIYHLKFSENNENFYFQFNLEHFHYWIKAGHFYEHYSGFGQFDLSIENSCDRSIVKMHGLVSAERGAGPSLPVPFPFTFFHYEVWGHKNGISTFLKVSGPKKIDLKSEAIFWNKDTNKIEKFGSKKKGNYKSKILPGTYTYLGEFTAGLALGDEAFESSIQVFVEHFEKEHI